MIQRKFLNVGGSSKRGELPAHFAGMEHHLLDILPGPDVDLCSDARLLTEQPRADYDALFCSHNLEHYYEHEIPQVLAGFKHMLSPTGFVHIIVPNLQQAMGHMAVRMAEPDAVLYLSSAGPVRYLDLIFGHGPQIARKGEPYAHKFGFSPKLLKKVLKAAGFEWRKVIAMTDLFEIHAFATVSNQPADWIRECLQLSEND
ncbi:MAG: class I SAM-dependent methyltransferase [Candidatus Sericytochromatia bacterium]|nr:class I SAM-dependent methyltransferase [Candidatus Sericytochromatia bacterium]